MKTIKVIDLLNMIANGKVPKKIKVNNIYTYIHDGIDYKSREGTYLFDSYIETTPDDMNKEVEILEEEKKLPEKINVKGSYNSNKGFEDFNDNEKILVDKINDLLDYLESKEKGE